MNTAQAQLGAVLAAGGPELARLLEAHRGAAGRGGGRSRRRAARGTRPRRSSAGGKRLRPMLVFLCANGDGDERLVAAAAAVELLHMATLVHDDVLDSAPLRRGRPTVFAEGGRLAATATGDLLFSRSFAELASTGSPDAVRALSEASSALARGELMQRADAWSAGRHARALPRALPAQDGQPVRGVVPARRPVRRPARDGRGARGVRRGHRPRLPDPRRRARRVGSGRAHGQAPRGGPARRHGHAAADPGARARPASWPSSTRSSRRSRPSGSATRVAATGALESAREQALAHVAEAKAALARIDLPRQRREALELVADGVVERYA